MKNNLVTMVMVLFVLVGCTTAPPIKDDILVEPPVVVEPVVEPEPEVEAVPEILPRFDFEYEHHAKVDYWIDRYTGKNRRYFRNTLYRFDKVRPQMEEIFVEHGLPKDLVYLALIESGGNPNAVSKAGATGCWQFMPVTAKRYDLNINRWIDERRDMEKATHAAAEYLSYLNSIFDDWLLAAAAYNAGEGTIKRLMRRHPEVKSFWDIEQGMPIKSETLYYVPKFIAAANVGKYREEYKMNVPHAKILPAYDVVKVDKFTYLDEVAEVAGRPLSQIAKLNPELIRGCTPPGYSNYALKVPVGTGEKINNYLAHVNDPNIKYATHKVAQGDTLYDLARRNNTTVAMISETNRIDANRYLSLGQVLIIPVNSEHSKPRRKHTYVVAAGENLGAIARKHNVLLQDLIDVNNISNPSMIQPEMVLNIPPQRMVADGANHIRYEVKEGDTVWGISRQFSVTSQDIMRWNKLSSASNIYPGDQLTIYR